MLYQYGTICDYVGWWIGFKKGGNSIYDVDIGLCDIVEVMGANNKLDPSHEALIGSNTIIVDGGKIL